jgi:hypothetical protein
MAGETGDVCWMCSGTRVTPAGRPCVICGGTGKVCSGASAGSGRAVRETYYDVLEIGARASPQEIKQAYRRQALRWHPDKNQGSRESHERFKRIAEAYAVLSDPALRGQYDAATAAGNAWQGAASAAVDAETAAALFLQEMWMLAWELTFQNVSWADIVPELVTRGCPKSIAQTIAREAEQSRKEAVRRAASRAFVQALLWFAAGAVVTGATYAAAKPGGAYCVTTGLFPFGGINMLRALYYLVTGRAPEKG